MALSYQYVEGGSLPLEVHTVSLNPASIGAGAQGTATATITGLTSSDIVIGSNCVGVLDTGLVFAGAVCSTDTLTVTLFNPTAGSVDGAAKSWNFFILRGSRAVSD